MNLEQILRLLQNYGKPRVGIYGTDGTWHCSVEMMIPSVGVSFEVKSDFKSKTPLEAAEQCHQRVLDVLKDFRENNPAKEIEAKP